MHFLKDFMMSPYWNPKSQPLNANFLMKAWKAKEFGGTKDKRSTHLPTSM